MSLKPWAKTELELRDGRKVNAQQPVIVSASRSTDIPTYYADWFFHRLKEGYSAWINPFNGQKIYIDYSKTRFIVFWSKDPRPMFDYLDQLKERDNPIDCYLQYSLNDYETVKEGESPLGIERNIASLANRIETFQKYSEKLGKERVIWRFDPLVLTDRLDVDNLLERIERIGEQIYKCTERFVFSFVDIENYKSVKTHLTKIGLRYKDWDKENMLKMAEGIAKLNQKWGLHIATCGEEEDLGKFGIEHSHCIDEDLIIKLAYKDKELMDYLQVQIIDGTGNLFENDDLIDLGNNMYAQKKKFSYKDKGQRQACCCTNAKDIGQYGTCLHQCQYCYANGATQTYETIRKNWETHNKNLYADTIIGKE